LDHIIEVVGVVVVVVAAVVVVVFMARWHLRWF
jgi:hypothetical protein